MKLETLNKLCDVPCHPDLKIKNKQELLEITMCPTDGKFYKQHCIKRNCTECGVHCLDLRLAPIIQACGEEELTWRKWATEERNLEGKKVKAKVVQVRSGHIHEYMDELKGDTTGLSLHLHTAFWQQEVFQTLTKKVPENSIVINMDFSENYSTFYQREISSAHWVRNQTVHPVVVFYTCQDEECTNTKPVQESLIFLSDDLRHDYHAVHAYVGSTITHMKGTRNIKFQKLHEFSDGCASQYKSRNTFADISFGDTDFSVEREHHYYASCHGKGPCDSTGGVVKTAIRRAVVLGKVTVNCAEELYRYCRTNLEKGAMMKEQCNHNSRTFFSI